MARRSSQSRGLTIGNAVLIVLATGIILTSPAGTMGLARNILREIEKRSTEFSMGSTEEERVRASLYRLKRKGYISKKITSKGIGFVLTRRGREAVQSQRLSEFSVPRVERWDGKWRFVLFDIPEKDRVMRNILRDNLRAADFFQVQKSAWVHPYPCNKEILFLAESLQLRPYVLVFEGLVNQSKDLVRFFQKKGYAL